MLVLIVSLLSALSTTALSLSCITCSSSTTTSCTGSSVSCPANHQCSSTYIFITSTGSNSTNFFRSCSSANQCNVTGSGRFPGGSLKMATSCCSEKDLCVPTTPELPSYNISTSANGVVCPQCVSTSSDQCSSEAGMICAGNEMTCLNFASTVTVNPSSAMAFRGCSTRSICAIDNQTFTTGELNSFYKYVCTNENPGLHHTSLVPSIVFALIFTLFL